MGTHIIWGEKFCIAFFPLVKVKAIYNINIEPVLYNFKAILKSYMVIIFHINVATYLIFLKVKVFKKKQLSAFILFIKIICKLQNTWKIQKNYEERNQNLHNTQLRDGHCLISFRLLSPYTAKL